VGAILLANLVGPVPGRLAADMSTALMLRAAWAGRDPAPGEPSV